MIEDFDAKAILTEGGGAAFPMEFKDHTGTRHVSFGLTARDYFAGQALMGLLTRGVAWIKEPIDPFEMLTNTAYKYADAMLEERLKEKPDAK